MAERIKLIDPACDVRLVEDFVEPSNFDALLGGGFGRRRNPWGGVRTSHARIID